MDNILEKLQPYMNDLLGLLLKILFGIVLIIAAWIVLKLTLKGVKRLLKMTKVDKLNDIINENELIAKSSFKVDMNAVIVNIVKYLLLLFFVIIVAEILNLPAISEGVAAFIAYLPKLATAILILVGGLWLATQAKNAIKNLLKSLDSSGSNAIGMLVFYLILIFVSITALNQAGVDTTIISSNLTFILGAALVTITIAVGLGSRDIVNRLLLGYYTKKNLEIGMKIQINDYVGTITAIDNICVVLDTNEGKIVIPIKKINNSTVKILNQSNLQNQEF